MNYKFYKFFLLAFLFIYCANKPKSYTNSSAVEFSVQEEDIPIGYKKLYLRGEITKKENLDNGDKYGCTEWSIKREDLKDILLDMKRVEPNEWYAKCYDYPCWYEGLVFNATTQYEITISSTSYVILSNDKETLHFILENDSDLFLVPCNCCE